MKLVLTLLAVLTLIPTFALALGGPKQPIIVAAPQNSCEATERGIKVRPIPGKCGAPKADLQIQFGDGEAKWAGTVINDFTRFESVWYLCSTL